MFAYPPSQQPDAGFAVVTDRFVCLLSGDATAEIARSVFRLLDGDDAQLDDALGALAPVEVVERFAIVEMLDSDARTLRVAVRGHVSVGVEGATATRLSEPAGATWIAGEASGVSDLWLSLDEQQPDGDLLPLARGVVRTGAVVADRVPGTLFPFVATAPEGDEGTPRWILRLPDGDELDADGTIVIGRSPWEQESGEGAVRHVSAPSPKKQISGTHLELAIADGQLVARDLDSTNGTIVLTPEGPPRLLHGGSAASLRTGDILDLGESFRIVVSDGH